MKYRLILILVLLAGMNTVFSQSADAGGELETLVLTIQPGYLVQEGDFVVFSPDSDVMRSRYVHYYMARENFLVVMGPLAGLTKPVKVTAVLVRLSDRTRVPGDPRLPSPDGGFTDIRYLAVLRGMVK